jgi:hypothetical protein
MPVRFFSMKPRIRLLTLCVGDLASQAEVDAAMRRAEQAGATIVKPAQPTFYGGYAGYFQDPGRPSLGSGVRAGTGAACVTLVAIAMALP